MNTCTDNSLEAHQANIECRSLNAPGALARRASTEATSMTGGYGLLGRMYPGLSHEQAAAMIRQRIMLDELRRTATSSRSRR
jgi:hypothetical protein